MKWQNLILSLRQFFLLRALRGSGFRLHCWRDFIFTCCKFANRQPEYPTPPATLARPSNPGRGGLVKGVYKCDKGLLFGRWILFGQ